MYFPTAKQVECLACAGTTAAADCGIQLPASAGQRDPASRAVEQSAASPSGRNGSDRLTRRWVDSILALRRAEDDSGVGPWRGRRRTARRPAGRSRRPRRAAPTRPGHRAQPREHRPPRRRAGRCVRDRRQAVSRPAAAAAARHRRAAWRALRSTAEPRNTTRRTRHNQVRRRPLLRDGRVSLEAPHRSLESAAPTTCAPTFTGTHAERPRMSRRRS